MSVPVASPINCSRGSPRGAQAPPPSAQRSRVWPCSLTRIERGHGGHIDSPPQKEPRSARVSRGRCAPRPSPPEVSPAARDQEQGPRRRARARGEPKHSDHEPHLLPPGRPLPTTDTPGADGLSPHRLPPFASPYQGVAAPIVDGQEERGYGGKGLEGAARDEDDGHLSL